MRDLEIGDLSLIVRRMFGLPDDADAKVTERLKHIRKLDFPSASRVGQGHRRIYGVGEVLKIAVAFQLIDAGLASTLSVRLVVKHWPTIAQALVSAIHGGGGRVKLVPNVVTDLSKAAAKSWTGGTCSVSAAPRWRPGAGRARSVGQTEIVPSPAIEIDLALLVRSAKRALKSTEGVASDELEGALEALCLSSATEGAGAWRSKAGGGSPTTWNA